MAKLGLLLLAVPLAGASQTPPEPAIFRSGTRLVEVQVVVRDPPVRPPIGTRSWFAWVLDSGPPFGAPGVVHAGFTKSDFVLLDNGKPQDIAVFHTSADASTSETALPVPPGGVSNREDARDQPVNGATAVLIDFLNTDFGCLGYERMGMTKLLRSITEADSRTALYTLGENLHVLQDFTDDPQRLMNAVAALGAPHGKLPAPFTAAIKDYGDLLDLGREQVHAQMTVKALRMILQHLSGMPGRKSLIWLLHKPDRVPFSVMAMAQRANIVLYPVLVRATGGELCPGAPISDAQELASATGGRAFFDSLDLGFAMRATEEDSASAYVLGYYPAEAILDGKYHNITVKLRDKGFEKKLEMHYRPGYFATKALLPPPAPTPQELFESPVDVTGIGLTAKAVPDPQHPGRYEVSLAVDLHDVHMDSKDGRFAGDIELTIPNPGTRGTVRAMHAALNLSTEDFARALQRGLPITVTDVESEGGQIRVTVRDSATGAAGSVRIPVPHSS